MNFQHTIQWMRDGSKTETRRPVKPYYRSISSADGKSIVAIRSCRSDGGTGWIDRLLWEVGRTYAVQNGRHAKSEGRFLLEYIKFQWLRSITDEEIRREMGALPDLVSIASNELGVKRPENHEGAMTPRRVFRYLWDSIHPLKREQWARNPLVVVLGFPEGMQIEG